MTKPIGYDPSACVLVIADNEVFPARSLRAYVSPDWQSRIQIDSLAGKGVQSIMWSDVTSLDGSYTPQSMADALSYLQGEFAKGPAFRAIPAIFPLNGAASFVITHGLSYAPSTAVLDPNGFEVDTDVAHSPGVTTLIFATPFTGTLYIG